MGTIPASGWGHWKKSQYTIIPRSGQVVPEEMVTQQNFETSTSRIQV